MARGALGAGRAATRRGAEALCSGGLARFRLGRCLPKLFFRICADLFYGGARAEARARTRSPMRRRDRHIVFLYDAGRDRSQARPDPARRPNPRRRGSALQAFYRYFLKYCERERPSRIAVLKTLLKRAAAVQSEDALIAFKHVHLMRNPGV